MYSIKQLITIVIIVAIVFFCLGYIISLPTNKTSLNNTVGQNTYQAGWEAAKQRLAETGFAPIMEGMEISAVSGEVKQIQENKISLKIQPLLPLADPDLDNRIIEIDSNIKIYQLEEKDNNEYQEELNGFNLTMQRQMENSELNQEMIMPPEPFTKKAASLSDIKVGAQINVEAGEDIKNLKEFDVITITIQFIQNIL